MRRNVFNQQLLPLCNSKKVESKLCEISKKLINIFNSFTYITQKETFFLFLKAPAKGEMHHITASRCSGAVCTHFRAELVPFLENEPLC